MAGLDLHEVFVRSGVPTHTFVEPVEFTGLVVALKTPGRSIIIEGPSGIGKTTAAMKAIAAAGLTDKIITLSARKAEDVEMIRALTSSLPIGTVLIDDFHRLSEDVRRPIADLMKTLADEGANHSKLIVLGIPNAGQALLQFGTDLANRIEIVRVEANPQFKVEELLAKGEGALNVSINIKSEIVEAAQGSFYLAQMLAHETCLRSKILSTQSSHCNTSESYEAVLTQVMTTLGRSFHDTTVAFARGSKLRREGRAPYLHLLYWLSQSKTWTINVEREASLHPAQRGSVTQVVTKGFLKDLISDSEAIQKVLHFDGVTLVAQDPQFVFFIRNISWPQFSEEIGFLTLEFPSRYDFALSFAGADRDIAEALFKALEEEEFEVFYDRNEQHRILAEDLEEYLAPIYNSDAQLVVCILGPDYPKRVWTKFESEQFKKRFGQGEVVPIVLNTAPLGIFDLANTVGHISWDRNHDMEEQVGSSVDLLKKKCVEIRDRRKSERIDKAKKL
ncbi:MAG: TIR domain-containing protein [Hyphomicrobiaceae bacterium]